jgi:antitoxin PrlF
MKISERGQVTIPKELREQLGLGPDTDVRFIVREGRLEIEKEPTSQRGAVERLYGRKKFGRTTDELMALLRE